MSGEVGRIDELFAARDAANRLALVNGHVEFHDVPRERQTANDPRRGFRLHKHLAP